MYKYTEQKVQRLKTYLNFAETPSLNTDAYKSVLEEMSFNMKYTKDVESLIIKNEAAYSINKRKTFEKATSESTVRSSDLNKLTNVDNEFQEKEENMTIVLHTDENVSNKLESCNQTDKYDGYKNTEENNIRPPRVTNNVNQNDLQSLLIMMTIDSLHENVEDNKALIETNMVNDQPHDISSPLPIPESQKELSTILKIIQLKKELNNRQKYIMKKYVQKWKNIIKLKKEENKMNQRQETLNNFLNNLAMKKNNSKSDHESVKYSKLMAQDYKTYQHRYKVQKQIIALQKAKLEQQNKMIEELKLNKIVESSNHSLQAIRENIRDAYSEVDRHLKPKLKILSNELKIKDLEDSSLILHSLKVPQFLQRMEARARQREEKHAMIRERRKQLEEERIRLKQQEELAKAEMSKEEKAKRIKELKEKRKKDKIENIRKKQHEERMRALTVMADLHYEKSLTAKYGIRPLKLLMKLKEQNIEKAKAHYIFQLKKNVFLHWMWYTEDMWYERNFKAEEFYKRKILKKGFESFKKHHYELVLKKQVAEDYYDFYIAQLVFRRLRVAVSEAKKMFEIKWHKAVIYHNSNLLFKTFTCWRTLPALNALQREQEVRKLKWRQKVLQVVPDYAPPED